MSQNRKKSAVVLLNMGGPNNLYEVELFLHNMFNDSHIITTKSALLRRFIAAMITFFRTESSMQAYSEIGGKSPLVDLTKQIVVALEEALSGEFIVDFAMRYTPPFADEVVARLKQQAVERVYLLPMYPQYSSTTTASSIEDFKAALHKQDANIVVYEISHYFENAMMNRAIVEQIKAAMHEKAYDAYDLIFSAHGLPQKIINAGDPYELHINEHVALLKTMLANEGMPFHAVHLAYQSKVGPMKWLTPSLEEKLSTIRNRGVIIYPLAFTVDNSETVYELHIEYEEIAKAMGFNAYHVVPCLNNNPLFVTMLADLVKKMTP